MPVSTPAPDESGHPRRSWAATARAVVVLTIPALGFVLPFLGPWLSMTAVVLAVRHGRQRVWREQERRRGLAPLAIAALWGPGLLTLAVFLSFGDRLGSPETSEGLQLVTRLLETAGATYWLFLPLAGPADIVTPALASFAVLAAGAAVSAHVHRPWPWLLGALAAPLAYAGVLLALGIPFVA